MGLLAVLAAGPGTGYPILDRLTEHGWVTGQEESGPHPGGGRPARRLYELTETGHEQATHILQMRDHPRSRCPEGS